MKNDKKCKAEPYFCSICGKSMARPETRPGSAKGLLAVHLKYKHPEEWDRRLREDRLRAERARETERISNLNNSIRHKDAVIIATMPGRAIR